MFVEKRMTSVLNNKYMTLCGIESHKTVGMDQMEALKTQASQKDVCISWRDWVLAQNVTLPSSNYFCSVYSSPVFGE